MLAGEPLGCESLDLGSVNRGGLSMLSPEPSTTAICNPRTGPMYFLCCSVTVLMECYTGRVKTGNQHPPTVAAIFFNVCWGFGISPFFHLGEKVSLDLNFGSSAAVSLDLGGVNRGALNSMLSPEPQPAQQRFALPRLPP